MKELYSLVTQYPARYKSESLAFDDFAHLHAHIDGLEKGGDNNLSYTSGIDHAAFLSPHVCVRFTAIKEEDQEIEMAIEETLAVLEMARNPPRMLIWEPMDNGEN